MKVKYPFPATEIECKYLIIILLLYNIYFFRAMYEIINQEHHANDIAKQNTEDINTQS